MCQSGFSQVVLWNKESIIRIRCYTIIGVGEVRSKRELKDKKYITHQPQYGAGEEICDVETASGVEIQRKAGIRVMDIC